MPAFSDLAKKDREAPAELSEADQKQWNDLRKDAEAFQSEMDGRVKDALLALAPIEQCELRVDSLDNKDVLVP